ncbi:hypothetical protein ECG_03910 [Echinococcus granulosus]|nr:hypothetical protein ECG_03910 [Echinococcus granulosus]
MYTVYARNIRLFCEKPCEFYFAANSASVPTLAALLEADSQMTSSTCSSAGANSLDTDTPPPRPPKPLSSASSLSSTIASTVADRLNLAALPESERELLDVQNHFVDSNSNHLHEFYMQRIRVGTNRAFSRKRLPSRSSTIVSHTRFREKNLKRGLFSVRDRDAPMEYVPTRRSHRDDAEMGRSRGHRRGGEEAERRTQPSGTSGRYFEKSFEKEEAVAVAVPATKASLSATKDFIQQIANKYPTSAVASKANDEQVSVHLGVLCP